MSHAVMPVNYLKLQFLTLIRCELEHTRCDDEHKAVRLPEVPVTVPDDIERQRESIEIVS